MSVRRQVAILPAVFVQFLQNLAHVIYAKKLEQLKF